jgi:hypothetical protein
VGGLGHFDLVQNFWLILLLCPYFMLSSAKHHLEGGSFLLVPLIVRSQTFNSDLNFATKRGGKISYYSFDNLISELHGT